MSDPPLISDLVLAVKVQASYHVKLSDRTRASDHLVNWYQSQSPRECRQTCRSYQMTDSPTSALVQVVQVQVNHCVQLSDLTRALYQLVNRDRSQSPHQCCQPWRSYEIEDPSLISALVLAVQAQTNYHIHPLDRTRTPYQLVDLYRSQSPRQCWQTCRSYQMTDPPSTSALVLVVEVYANPHVQLSDCTRAP